MTKETIKQEAIEVISQLFKEKGFNLDILERADWMDHLGIDSITFISIVVEIEAHFGIEIPDDMLSFENFKSIDNIVSTINTLLTAHLEVDAR